MALFGLVIMGKVIYAYLQGIPPEALTMGLIGVLALLANVFLRQSFFMPFVKVIPICGQSGCVAEMMPLAMLP